MNFLQRAINYVWRKPTKSLLLVVTFFLIGNLVILGLGISQAAGNAKILTRKKMRAIVSYEVDYNAFWKYLDSIEDSDEQSEAAKYYPSANVADAERLAKDDRVRAYNCMINNTAYAIGFDFVHLNNQMEEDMTNNSEGSDYTSPTVMIYANLTPQMIELEEGTITVQEGRWYNQSDIDAEKQVVCISKELAETNDFHVGDTLTVACINPKDPGVSDAGYSADDISLELEIVGIYNTKEDVDPNADNFRWMSPYESPKNRLMMPLSSYQEYHRTLTEVQYKMHPDWFDDSLEDILARTEGPSRVVYLLDDPLNVDKFVSDNQNQLADFMILNANNETFIRMARPLDTMNFFASIVVWIVIVNAVVIISLVTALTLKTREFEIGVLLSIGVSKLIVVAQLFVELILLAFIGFGLASVSGSLMAGSVGEMVLDYQTASDAQYDKSEDEYSYLFSSGDSYFTEVSQADLLSEYHVSVSPLLILEIFLLGTGVVLIAIVIPSFMIMRLNPKQILLEQN